MSDHRKLAHLEEQLGDKLYQALISSDNTEAVRTFAATLVRSVYLTLIATVTVRPMAKFIAMEFFRVNTKKDAPVRISCLGNNFVKWFLGKTEERVDSEVSLRYHNLTSNSLDAPIIAELGGGEAKAETNLAEIAALMEKQGHGESGPLLTNGFANIFYVRDTNGLLRAVYVGWLGGGWDVHANSGTGPIPWDAGSRVFSCDL